MKFDAFGTVAGVHWTLPAKPGLTLTYDFSKVTPQALTPGDSNALIFGESLAIMRAMPADSIDLIISSPPYEKAREYGGGCETYAGEDWVSWFIPYCWEAARVCRGLVAFVVEGQTRGFEYSATPFLLLADLKRFRRCNDCGMGVGGYSEDKAYGKTNYFKLGKEPRIDCANHRLKKAFRIRKPPIYSRWGTPGSGGNDWLKNRWEPIISFTKEEIRRLPWSDNTACGHPPKYGPGGNPSNRGAGDKRAAGRKYIPPKLANPGNIIDCGAAGGGNIGADEAHEGEAPFPEMIPEFFIKSFCEPGGLVFDPFLGSGTTAAVAAKLGRRFIGIDVRADQIEISRRRLAG